MGRCLTKMMFMVLTPILLLHLLISSSSGAALKKHNESGVRTSEAEYESKGKPKSADGDFEVIHRKTCCSASRMHAALSSFENMAAYKKSVRKCLVSVAVKNVDSYGEAFKMCLDLFERLECLICHQNVETQFCICPLGCDKVVEAYFSSNASTQITVSCGENEGVFCGKASKWESNGTAFCDAAGFTVQAADDSVEEPCYRSKSSLEPLVESLLKTENFTWFQDLQKQLRELFWTFQVVLSAVCAIYGLEFNSSIDKGH